MFAWCAMNRIIAGLLLATALPIAGIAQTEQGAMFPDFEAGRLTYDGASGRFVMEDVRYARDDHQVKADRAEHDSLNFTRGLWNLSQNVEFRASTITMNCESAELLLGEGGLERATVLGDPVTIRNEGKWEFEGSAPRVEYVAENALLTLSGGVRLETVNGRINSESIVYDLVNDTIEASPGDEPVQFLYDFVTSGEDEGT